MKKLLSNVIAAGTLLLIASSAAAADSARDPFRPFVNPQLRDVCDKTRDTRPDIRSLKLVAVLSTGDQQHAVLEDAARMGRTVSTGAEVRTGQSVSRIDADHIEVEERLASVYGEKRIVHERWLDPASREPVCKLN